MPPLVEALLHVHYLYPWQGTLPNPLAEDCPLVPTHQGVKIGLQGRRCRAQDDHCPFLSCPHKGHFSGMITWGGILLISYLMLLIHHYETQVLYRGKDRRTCPNHYPGLPSSYGLPLVVTLGPGKVAVQYRYYVTKTPAIAFYGLGGKGYLRHQDYCPTPHG